MKKVYLLFVVLGVIAGVLYAKIESANRQFDLQVRAAKQITGDPCNWKILRVLVPPPFSTRSQTVILAGEDYLGKEDQNKWYIFPEGGSLVVYYRWTSEQDFFYGGSRVVKNTNAPTCTGKVGK